MALNNRPIYFHYGQGIVIVLNSVAGVNVLVSAPGVIILHEGVTGGMPLVICAVIPAKVNAPVVAVTDVSTEINASTGAMIKPAVDAVTVRPSLIVALTGASESAPVVAVMDSDALTVASTGASASAPVVAVTLIFSPTVIEALTGARLKAPVVAVTSVLSTA